jgi:VWFA-related protein
MRTHFRSAVYRPMRHVTFPRLRKSVAWELLSAGAVRRTFFRASNPVRLISEGSALKSPAILAFALAITSATFAQTPPAASPNTTLRSQSTLVLVPALVREKKSGQLIYTFKADDFVLTDDGVPQKLHLEEDTGGEPLALVVDIEGGGAGAAKLLKDTAIATMLDSIVGGVPHKIAIVGYDSSPVLVTDFTDNTDAAADGIAALIKDDNGDDGAATLDSIGFSVDLLRKQPLEYRRMILLISESLDRGSKLTLDDALHAISDTNTTIYSIGFSTVTAELGHKAAMAVSDPNPGPAHGCMSRDPNDPNVDLSKNIAEQAFDCLGVLAPPLVLARAAANAVRDGLRKNIPETVARLTGGEYFKYGTGKNLEKDLHTISNHIPNRYILSFQPQSPHPGFHAIELTLPSYSGVEVSARNGYWADTTAPPAH